MAVNLQCTPRRGHFDGFVVASFAGFGCSTRDDDIGKVLVPLDAPCIPLGDAHKGPYVDLFCDDGDLCVVARNIEKRRVGLKEESDDWAGEGW